MLSKIQMLVLGIIKEAPINPYEIIRLFKELHVDKWLPYAESSIYASINSLVKKNFIVSKTEKLGKMPEKSVYSIQKEGTIAFDKNLKNFFLDISGDYMQFTIVILFICHLSKNEASKLIEERIINLTKVKDRLEKRVISMQKDIRIPHMSIMSAINHLNYVEASLKTAIELKNEVKQTQTWESFLSKELN